MAGGLLIRNAAIVNANGTYNDYHTQDVTGLNRSWLSVDKLVVVRYVTGTTTVYVATTDTVGVAGKQYYTKNDDGMFVRTTSSMYNQTLPPNSYFEVYEPINGWVIQRAAVTPTGGLLYGELLYKYETQNESSSPYDYGLIWTNHIGEEVMLSITRWDESSIVTTTSDPVVDPITGTTTVTTTMTNTVTGDVYRETNVIHNKVVYPTREIVRYDNVNLSIGKVYRFQFVSDFEKLGYVAGKTDQSINAGIFRADKVMSYLDMVASGIDLYSNLYIPCNVPKDVYLSDLGRIADSPIYRLVDPTDESVVYFVPLAFIRDTPDASVDECSKLMLTIDLGIHNDPELLDDMSDFIAQIVEKKWGITPAVGVDSLVNLVAYDKIWLTTEQHETFAKQREDMKQKSKVDFATLFHLEESNIHYRENLRLKGKIAVLEDLVKQLNNSK